MFVGTTYNEETGIYEDQIPGHNSSAKSLGDGDAGIYDFTQPSPPATGDDSSPMNS